MARKSEEKVPKIESGGFADPDNFFLKKYQIFCIKIFFKNIFSGNFIWCFGGLLLTFGGHTPDNNPLELIELCQNHPLRPPESKN